jgi:hypothetical protein
MRKPCSTLSRRETIESIVIDANGPTERNKPASEKYG